MSSTACSPGAVRLLVHLAVAAASALSALSALAVAAFAQDFVRDTIPPKWVDPLVPEDLPALEFPEYDDEVDRAEKMVFAGRYKLALITLAKVNEPKPEQLPVIAVTKGRAFMFTGGGSRRCRP